MKIIKAIAGVSATILCTTTLAATNRYQIDKGTVVLSFQKTGLSEDISYNLNPACKDTKLVISKNPAGFTTITHSGQECTSGATIRIPVNAESSVDLVLGAGIVSFANPKEFSQAFGPIKLKVNAGIILSKTLETEKINYYSGEKSLVTANKSNEKSLDVVVEAGTISF